MRTMEELMLNIETILEGNFNNLEASKRILSEMCNNDQNTFNDLLLVLGEIEVNLSNLEYFNFFIHSVRQIIYDVQEDANVKASLIIMQMVDQREEEFNKVVKILNK